MNGFNVYLYLKNVMTTTTPSPSVKIVTKQGSPINVAFFGYTCMPTHERKTLLGKKSSSTTILRKNAMKPMSSPVLLYNTIILWDTMS